MCICSLGSFSFLCTPSLILGPDVCLFSSLSAAIELLKEVGRRCLDYFGLQHWI